jgi:hypothetical protein
MLISSQSYLSRMLRLMWVTAPALVVCVLSCSRQGDHEQDSKPASKVSGRDATLAVVGGEHITVADFETELNRRARASGMKYTREGQRRALLDEMVEFKVLLNRARAAGYDRNPELVARFEELVVGKFREDHLAGNTVAAAKVSEEEAREFYQLNQQRFATPESVHVAIMYFKSSPKATKEKRAEVKKKAEAVLAKARQTDPAGFSDLVRRYSDDQATRYSGGDIGWLAPDDASQNGRSISAQAALEIREPGAFAPLVETPGGFYIVRLLERRSSGYRPFEQVKEAIAYELAQQKRYQQQRDLFEEMKRGLKIEINPAALKLISPTEKTVENTPPPLPSS